MIFSLLQQIQLHNSTGKLTQVKVDNSTVLFELRCESVNFYQKKVVFKTSIAVIINQITQHSKLTQ